MTQRSVKLLFKHTVVFFGLLSMVRFVLCGATMKTGRFHVGSQANKQNLMCSMHLKNSDVRLPVWLLKAVMSDTVALTLLHYLSSFNQAKKFFKPLSL